MLLEIHRPLLLSMYTETFAKVSRHLTKNLPSVMMGKVTSTKSKAHSCLEKPCQDKSSFEGYTGRLCEQAWLRLPEGWGRAHFHTTLYYKSKALFFSNELLIFPVGYQTKFPFQKSNISLKVLRFWHKHVWGFKRIKSNYFYKCLIY